MNPTLPQSHEEDPLRGSIQDPLFMMREMVWLLLYLKVFYKD